VRQEEKGRDNGKIKINMKIERKYGIEMLSCLSFDFEDGGA